MGWWWRTGYHGGTSWVLLGGCTQGSECTNMLVVMHLHAIQDWGQGSMQVGNRAVADQQAHHRHDNNDDDVILQCLLCTSMGVSSGIGLEVASTSVGAGVGCAQTCSGISVIVASITYDIWEGVGWPVGGLGQGQQVGLVMPQFCPEPMFKPELWRTWPKSGPKFTPRHERNLRSSPGFRQWDKFVEPIRTRPNQTWVVTK